MIAGGFVQAGARVYISSRKADVCDAAATELSKYGTCISLPTDLTSEQGRSFLVDELGTRESRLDVLVNNAGATWAAPLEEYPESGWTKVMDTNLKSIFFLTQAMLPLLRKAGSFEHPARVLNVSSIEGLRVPMWENYAYPASKAAVLQLTRHLAIRLAPDNVVVNSIAPGFFPSKMTSFLLDDPDGTGDLEREIPLRRVGQPDDIVGVAIFLASKAGAYLTGSTVVVDGGISIS